MVSGHLLKADKLALCPKFITLFEDANKLLEKLKMELSFQEENFMRESLVTQAILSPKIIIKDHKKINKKGEFPTSLVILTTNFIATFSRLATLGSSEY